VVDIHSFIHSFSDFILRAATYTDTDTLTLHNINISITGSSSSKSVTVAGVTKCVSEGDIILLTGRLLWH